jgi:hypothetical protein
MMGSGFVLNKIFYYLSLVVILSTLALMLVVGWLAFHPVKVLQPNIQPYKVITPVVQRLGVIIYQVDACKFREAPTVISRRFVDTNNTHYPLPDLPNNIKTGCAKTNVPVTVPPTLPPGTYYLTLDVSYQVNIFRTESYHLRTDTFWVE